MIYLYAVAEAGCAAPACTGVRESAVRMLDEEGLAAAVSELDGEPPEPSEAAMWEHEQVVEALMTRCAVLPMRFGSLLSSESAVQSLLRARAPEFSTALEQVRGAVEIGVRAAWALQSPASGRRGAPASPLRDEPREGEGAAYLRDLVEARRRAEELAERVHRPLSELARASRSRLLRTPKLPLSGTYLVERGRLDAFKDRVAALDAEVSDAEILCTGPWPPYSFVAGEEGA